MKGFLKYALPIFLMVAFTGVNAQIKTRYTGGLNLTTMELKIDGLSSDPTMPFGIHFGWVFEMPVGGGFAFDPGILFSAKGTDYKVDSVDFSLSPIYIEVPLNVAYSFGSNTFKIFLFAGPYFACGVGGTCWKSGYSLQDLRFGKGEDKDLKFFDVGLNFGLGVNIKMFLVTAQYGLGLLNISPDETGNMEMRNNVIGISVSTSFIGKN